MKQNVQLPKMHFAALAVIGFSLAGLMAGPVTAQTTQTRPLVPLANVAHPFEESVYLYNQSYDTDIDPGYATGIWGQYKAWLGAPVLGAEADPGWGNGDWYDCCDLASWNRGWGTQQQRYGAALPTVILGMGEMPVGYLSGDGNALDFENTQWQTEASGNTSDPNYNYIMGNFADCAKQIDALGFSKVTVRLGYEFDGFWNPFGTLNQMSNMPANYIAAWQNIVTTMRANDPKGIIKFCWNPTDTNVGLIYSPNFYPGDAYVDYIGIDTYDSSTSGEYPVSTVQPTLAQQTAAWNTELGRINGFASMARAHSKPMVIGEWGLWQLNDGNHPSGGDNPSYIQNMYNWMSDPNNNVAAECYFEAPSDGDSSLSGIFHPTSFPNAANMFLRLFGSGGKPSAPPTPTGLNAFGNSGKVILNWNASIGIPAATYSIYRGTSPGGEGVKPIKTGLTETATSFANTGLRNGTTYYYTVKAVNSAGVSSASNEASALAGVPANYLLNGGFETGNTAGWSLWVGNNAQASYVEQPAAGSAHSGAFQYTHWSPWSYQVTLYQPVSNVTNGPHTVSAWVKSSGGQYTCQMEVTTNGVKTVVPINASSVWTQISTPVTVTTGSVSVGFYSNAAGNQWINLDDVVVK